MKRKLLKLDIYLFPELSLIYAVTAVCIAEHSKKDVEKIKPILRIPLIAKLMAHSQCSLAPCCFHLA